MQAAHTVLAAEAIAQALGQRPELGDIRHCELLRRGFNEVYDVHAAGGRHVARLSSLRARGPANTAFEMALLGHLHARGADVAPAVGASLVLPLPEGPRDLVVFRHVPGSWPEAPEDFELTGAALARIHTAAADYEGPPSRYTLDLDHLLTRPLGWLMAAPTMDDALREAFTALVQELRERIGGGAGLTRVVCHGDCHGGNNYVSTDEKGARRTAFFDFDDAGPGWLAYDLAVFLWGQLPRKLMTEVDEDTAAKYLRFISGYAGAGVLPPADLDALPLFLAVRNVWLIGEYASRRHHWGSQMIPTPWLRKQVPLMRSWMALRPPRLQDARAIARAALGGRPMMRL